MKKFQALPLTSKIIFEINFFLINFLPPISPSVVKEITLVFKVAGGAHLEIPAKMYNVSIGLIA